MGQITIYLDAQTEKKVKSSAKRSGKSVSGLISDLVHRDIKEIWPEEIAAMAGSWKDFPDQDKLRSGTGKDSAREKF